MRHSVGATRVSVIVPTYNSRDLVECAVESVTAQTIPPHEIIVVDDGSSDDTEAWARSQEGRFRYVRQENEGAAAARNRGAALASGDLIAFLDADDVWLPEKLERQLEALAKRPWASFVFSDGYRVATTGAYVDVFAATRSAARLSSLYARPPMILELDWEFRMHCVPTSSLLVPRRLFRAVGEMPRISQGEDFVLCCRLLFAGPAVYVDEPLMVYRVHAGNTSSMVHAGSAWRKIRMKDAARLAAASASDRSTRPTPLMRRYCALPFVLRLFLLLAWRVRYGTSLTAIGTAILRYMGFRRPSA